ncbi:mucin-22-like [Pecten maximus]|uniref:mucin-22-like n=1 Tax=Pecten maximus TaxID=6579 RepID=UPI001458BC31|nr:mucin-22-like [Pecten maximus]
MSSESVVGQETMSSESVVGQETISGESVVGQETMSGEHVEGQETMSDPTTTSGLDAVDGDITHSTHFTESETAVFTVSSPERDVFSTLDQRQNSATRSVFISSIKSHITSLSKAVSFTVYKHAKRVWGHLMDVVVLVTLWTFLMREGLSLFTNLVISPGKLNWTAAKEYCNDMNGGLLVLDSQEKWDYFTAQDQYQEHRLNKGLYWIGMRFNDTFACEGGSSRSWVYSGWAFSRTTKTSIQATTSRLEAADDVFTHSSKHFNRAEIAVSTESSTASSPKSDGVSSTVFSTTPTTEGESKTTFEPTTSDPTTSDLTTSDLTTFEPTTSDMTSDLTTYDTMTSNPTTYDTTTSDLKTSDLTTFDPTTSDLTTFDPTTSNQATSDLTTSGPTTSDLTTFDPTTSVLTTYDLTTFEPTTFEPTTFEPTTFEPTTSDPTTSDSTTSDPTTSDPTTSDPTTYDLTTSDQTTSVSTSITSLVTSDVENDTCIKCCLLKKQTKLARYKLDEMMRVLRIQLEVNKTMLSSQKRKLVSVYDSRPSSVAMGGVACIILAAVVGVIVIPDGVSLVRLVYKQFKPQKDTSVI